MQDIDLAGKHFMTFGMKNCGKSYYNNYLMSHASRPYICFDPLREHTDYSEQDLVITPTVTRGQAAIDELSLAIEFAIENRDTFGYIWCDEINRFHSKGGQLEGPLGDLVDLNAHYNMGVGMVARRPVQVHTDLRELADYMFIFRLSGTNDVRVLDSIAAGLGERAASLDPRQYIVVYPDRSYQTFPPIRDRLNHNKGV